MCSKMQHHFLIGLKQFQHAEFIYSYIDTKKDRTFILMAT